MLLPQRLLNVNLDCYSEGYWTLVTNCPGTYIEVTVISIMQDSDLHRSSDFSTPVMLAAKEHRAVEEGLDIVVRERSRNPRHRRL